MRYVVHVCVVYFTLRLIINKLTHEPDTIHDVVVEEEEDVVQRQRAHQVQEEPGPDHQPDLII
jgi:hypothetical protein